jgi:membrane protein DedA with SNARE-associated domain
VKQTLEFLIRHGYLLLFFWLLGEQAALPLPSVPLLLACGALARQGRMQWHLVLMYGLAACLLADNVWFQLGRQRGTRILRFICRIALEPDSCVRQTENAFLRFGMRSLLVAKFVPGLNAVAAPLAGRSGASRGRFLVFDILGTSFWISVYTGIGYIFSDQLETVAGYAAQMGSDLIILIAGLLGAWLGWKYFQRRRFLRDVAMARITAEELRELIDSGEDVLIVDVRGPLPDELSAIPKALKIPTNEMAERHEEIPRDRDLILVCN